jgi:hypothetical protein
MSSLAPYDDALALLQGANLGVPIKLPNTPWTNPSPPALWIDFEIIGDSLNPIELNGGAWQEEGRVFCHIVSPVNKGSRDARTLAKTVANVFRGLGPRNVVYLGASIGLGLSPDPSEAWWTLTVMIDYRYQDFVSS